MNRPVATSAFALLVAASLLGCVGAPPSVLAKEGEITSFVIEASPDVAYRKVVEGARSCFEKSFEVTADWFAGSHSGRVSVALKTALASSSLIVVDIEPLEKGAAVRVAAHRATTAMPANVKKWLNGENDACAFK